MKYTITTYNCHNLPLNVSNYISLHLHNINYTAQKRNFNTTNSRVET
jgi:hypothetical protein